MDTVDPTTTEQATWVELDTARTAVGWHLVDTSSPEVEEETTDHLICPGEVVVVVIRIHLR